MRGQVPAPSVEQVLAEPVVGANSVLDARGRVRSGGQTAVLPGCVPREQTGGWRGRGARGSSGVSR